MKPTRFVLASALLISMLGVCAAAATPHQHAFEPPSASELGLDASHASAWNRLREESMQLRASAREDILQRLLQADALLAGSAPDLGAFSAEIDRQVDDLLAHSRDLRARKLALYESLSPNEQNAVREAMRAHLERARRLRAAFATLLFDAY